MRSLYPRSFLRLIVLGNIIAALPVLAALGYVVVAIERQTGHNEAVMRQAARVARLGYELPEGLDAMERVLRQYTVLGDQSLLGDYEAMRRRWDNELRDCAGIPLLAGLSGRIAGVRWAMGTDTHFVLGGRMGVQGLQSVIGEARSYLRAVFDEANRLVEREVEAARREAADMRHHLLVAVAQGLLTTALFMLLSRHLLAGLLNRFEAAVIALGEGRLEQEIRLVGPEDMRKVGQRLDWLRRRLLALEQQRVLVLRHVSHELKTPLAALREGSSLLGEGAAGTLTPAQTKIVGIMGSNALRLYRLIDGLLKLQTVGYAASHLQPAPVRFDELIRQVLTTHQLAVRCKRLRFAGRLAPLVVVGGREELTTVVDNLISNAVKYSPEGASVTLSLAEADGRVVFDVIDCGPGVRAEERERIFEPFYRSSTAKEVAAGAGLGLAIAREFALAHRGSLELVTAERGCHFRVLLPLQRAAT